MGVRGRLGYPRGYLCGAKTVYEPGLGLPRSGLPLVLCPPLSDCALWAVLPQAGPPRLTPPGLRTPQAGALRAGPQEWAFPSGSLQLPGWALTFWVPLGRPPPSPRAGSGGWAHPGAGPIRELGVCAGKGIHAWGFGGSISAGDLFRVGLK